VPERAKDVAPEKVPRAKEAARERESQLRKS